MWHLLIHVHTRSHAALYFYSQVETTTSRMRAGGFIKSVPEPLDESICLWTEMGESKSDTQWSGQSTHIGSRDTHLSRLVVSPPCLSEVTGNEAALIVIDYGSRKEM